MLIQGKYAVSTMLVGLLLLALLITGLLLSSAAHARYKPIVSLNCPDGILIIDAKLGAAVGNGSASYTLRHRYRGITLKKVWVLGSKRVQMGCSRSRFNNAR